MRNLFRFLTLFLLFALLLPATPVALAQDFSPQHTDPGWQAFYWNNPDLSGAPVVQRFDNDLNFDWVLTHLVARFQRIIFRPVGIAISMSPPAPIALPPWPMMAFASLSTMS